MSADDLGDDLLFTVSNIGLVIGKISNFVLYITEHSYNHLIALHLLDLFWVVSLES